MTVVIAHAVAKIDAAHVLLSANDGLRKQEECPVG